MVGAAALSPGHRTKVTHCAHCKASYTLYCVLSALESHLGLSGLMHVNVSLCLLHSAVQTGIKAHTHLGAQHQLFGLAGWFLKDKQDRSMEMAAWVFQLW